MTVEVKVTTDDGEFTGKTKGEAMRAARKAAEDRRDRENRLREGGDVARTRAQAAGYMVLAMLARVACGDRDAVPRGWRIKRPGEEHGPKVKVRSSGYDGHTAIYDTPHARAEYDHCGSWVVAVLEDGGGHDVAVWLQDIDHAHNGEPVRAYAIGTALADGAGVVAFVELPGVKVESFAGAKGVA